MAKNYFEYKDFEVFEDDRDFGIGMSGAGLTLKPKAIKGRSAHTFREAELALNRTLTRVSPFY